MPGLWKRIKSKFTKPRNEEQPADEGHFDIDDILAIGDETKIIVTLIEPISKKFNRVGFDNLTEPEKVFYCVYWLEGEVNNGGFNQYFFNSAGDFAQETVVALRKIGAHYTADILLQSFSVFPKNSPIRDRYKRQKVLLKIGEEKEEFLNELDEKFFAYTDPIGSLLIEYIKKQKDHIQI